MRKNRSDSDMGPSASPATNTRSATSGAKKLLEDRDQRRVEVDRVPDLGGSHARRVEALQAARAEAKAQLGRLGRGRERDLDAGAQMEAVTAASAQRLPVALDSE